MKNCALFSTITRHSLWAFLLFVCPFSAAAQLQINEVCSSNSTVLMDEFGEFPDWIELYNASTESIDLEGYFLTDNPENRQKWVFPEVEILANDYLIIFAAGDEEETGPLHADFKISREGEYVGLFKPDLSLVDESPIPELYQDFSYARLPNNNAFIYTSTPTPGNYNDSDVILEINDTPVFTIIVFQNNSNKEVVIEGEGNHYYTLDGSIPDEDDLLYDGNIEVTSSVVIRARTFSTQKLPSAISSKTVFVNIDHDLPILSLITEPENFWDEEDGILVEGPDADTAFPFYGANFWKDISIPVYVEYYNTDAFYQFGQAVKAEVHGGRGARTLPQKPLRLTASKQYGEEHFDFPFFDYRDQKKYKHIVLRNASGDWGHAHMRDAYMEEYFEKSGIDVDMPGYSPCIVYLNAEYYGVMNIRDKVDEHFLAATNDGDPDLIEVLERDSIAITGNFDLFREMLSYLNENDLSSQTAFDSAAFLFDITEISDYFMLQTIINNFDWPGNNLKYWREKKEGERWRYVLFDLDGCCGRYPWSKAKFNSIGTRFEQFPENSLIQILTAFLDNPTFRNYFINRYADLLNSVLRTENISEATLAAADRIRPDIRRHFNHWSEVSFNTWEVDRIPTLLNYFEERPDFMRSDLQEFFELDSTIEVRLSVFPPAAAAGKISINTLNPTVPWDGIYFKGVPIDVEVTPNPGYTFSHWQTDQDLENLESTTISQSFQNDVSLTAVFNTGVETEELIVFPNPTTSYVQFVLPKNFEFENVRLQDALGKTVFYSEALEGRIDVLDLRTGIYFLSVQDSDGKILNKPVSIGLR